MTARLRYLLDLIASIPTALNVMTLKRQRDKHLPHDVGLEYPICVACVATWPCSEFIDLDEKLTEAQLGAAK